MAVCLDDVKSALSLVEIRAAVKANQMGATSPKILFLQNVLIPPQENCTDPLLPADEVSHTDPILLLPPDEESHTDPLTAEEESYTDPVQRE